MTAPSLLEGKIMDKKFWVFRFENGEMLSELVSGDVPTGWYKLIREAQLASRAPEMNQEKTSPVGDLGVKEAKEKVGQMTDRAELEAVIDRDTRKTVSQVAEARLAELG